MKKRGMFYVLAAEAAACVCFCLPRMNVSGIFSSLAAFPFEQTGWALRLLSLSGTLGNVAAIGLYTALSLLPCLAWLLLKKKGRLLRIDHALPVISLLLFVVNYYMINPGLFVSNIPGTGKWILGGTFYSVFSGYLVIRVLLSCRSAASEQLQNILQGLLWFLNMVFVYLIFGRNLGSLMESVRNMQGRGSGIYMEGFSAGAGTAAYVFLALGYLVSILPYVFDLCITFLSIRMLSELKADRYSDASVKLTDRLAGLCTGALCVTVSADMLFNVLQVLFRFRLEQVDLVIHVPVISIVFVLTVLLFARYVHEDQKLKQDHDMII